MSCNEFKNNLPDLIDGSLSEELKTKMLAHKDSCLLCNQIYTEHCKIVHTFANAKNPVPNHMHENILKRLSVIESENKINNQANKKFDIASLFKFEGIFKLAGVLTVVIGILLTSLFTYKSYFSNDRSPQNFSATDASEIASNQVLNDTKTALSNTNSINEKNANKTPAAKAIVKLAGTGFTPKTPALLGINETFACNNSGSGRLSYPEGTYINILANTKGQILSDGIRLNQGKIWVAYRKKGHYFAVKTPTAVLGVRGTDFGVSVNKDFLMVVLATGSVEVTPTTTERKSVILKPGETLLMNSSKMNVHATTKDELNIWHHKSAKSQIASLKTTNFYDQYLFYMTTFEEGSATASLANKNIVENLRPGMIIKTGSTVTTSDHYAKLSLLCGSKIVITPNSTISIDSNSLNVVAGTCLIRHVSRKASLKVKESDQLPLEIKESSFVAIERSKEGLLVKVEVGEVDYNGKEKKILAGECAQITSEGVVRTSPKPMAFTSEKQALQIFLQIKEEMTEDMPDSDIFDDLSVQDTADDEQQDSQPVEPQSESIATGSSNMKSLHEVLDL
ncbi:MAG: FecR family protein [Massilibacteroides sp.]|nr:FecR family protein [Massilibacteroides sp.]MDD3063186.1 FecR family protein [Massilibacteroides sp.]